MSYLKEDKNSMLLLIDFEKSIWYFELEIYRASAGFCQAFIKLYKTIYKNSNGSIINNGHLSSSF